MKDVAKGIVKEIMSSTEGTGNAMDIYDLFDMGVDGPLLREVLEILNRTGFVVDTHFSEVFDKVVENNIKACKKDISKGDNPTAINELALLQAQPRIYVGVLKGLEHKKYADSGIPLFIKHYKSSELKLMHLASSLEHGVMMVDEKMLGYDSRGFDHKILN